MPRLLRQPRRTLRRNVQALRPRTVEAVRRGAAVVELAILMPFLAALLLGMAEIGQSLRVEATLGKATRSAAGLASRPGGSNSDALTEVQTTLSAAGVPTSAATITVLVNDQPGNAAAARRNDKITVTLSLPTAAIRLTGSSFFSASDSVQTVSTTMLKQG